MKLQRIRGTTDLYDKDIDRFNHVVSYAKQFAELYCFDEIATPIMENSEVFHRTLGETSDIVNKETYHFLDRDKTNITLRPEFTAAIVRSIISNGMLQSLPLRLFSYGPLFRHERPQKCRLRQFHQINFEYIGSNSLKVDVELINLAYDILNSLKILDKIKLKINTLGNFDCRNKYKEALKSYLLKYRNDLSDISLIRLEKNPLRILDTKNEKERMLLDDAPNLYNFIDNNSKSTFEKIMLNLQDLDIEFEHEKRLVRGMDYYSGFVFEFMTEDLGSQGTVIAGGRYDSLISTMGGKETPASGFAGGIERLMELLSISSNELQDKKPLYLIPIGEFAESKSLKISDDFRSENIITLVDYEISLKKRMQKANKLNVDFAIIYGDNELQNKTFILKNLNSGVEEAMNKEQLLNYIKKSIK